MRSVLGVLALLIALAAVAFVALRPTRSSSIPVAAGGAASGPAERARTAQQRAAEDVAKAMDAASASRDAAEAR